MSPRVPACPRCCCPSTSRSCRPESRTCDCLQTRSGPHICLVPSLRQEGCRPSDSQRTRDPLHVQVPTALLSSGPST
eukprot:1564381-Rhodomonas_salina.1